MPGLARIKKSKGNSHRGLEGALIFLQNLDKNLHRAFANFHPFFPFSPIIVELLSFFQVESALLLSSRQGRDSFAEYHVYIRVFEPTSCFFQRHISLQRSSGNFALVDDDAAHNPSCSQDSKAPSMITGSSFAVVLTLMTTCTRLWVRIFRSRMFGADGIIIVPAAIGCVACLAQHCDRKCWVPGETRRDWLFFYEVRTVRFQVSSPSLLTETLYHGCCTVTFPSFISPFHWSGYRLCFKTGG